MNQGYRHFARRRTTSYTDDDAALALAPLALNQAQIAETPRSISSDVSVARFDEPRDPFVDTNSHARAYLNAGLTAALTRWSAHLS